jgi:hypothetical protein
MLEPDMVVSARAGQGAVCLVDEGLQLIGQEGEVAVRQGRAAVDVLDVAAHVVGQGRDQVGGDVLAQT